MPASNEHESVIRRFVGRFRSNSSPKPSKAKPSKRSASASPPSRRAAVAAPPPSSSSSSQQQQQPRIKQRSRTIGASPSVRIAPRQYQTYARDADISLGLWSSAYDFLGDRSSTAGLVLAYESIISQELPDQLKVGINTTLRNHPKERRLELVTAIALNGLRKRRASKATVVDEFSRQILDASKDSVGLMLDAYPSVALAFTGICALTPLPLDPVLRKGEMRAGVRYVAGRIQWYMYLSQLLMPETWRSGSSFRAQQEMGQTRELVEKLYRKVLEFEMNCVCASAISWNNAAKNVVGWQSLGALLEAIREADAELARYIDAYCTESARARLLPLNKDFDAVSTGFFAELGATPVVAQAQFPIRRTQTVRV
ncbi:hypothetical protein B0I35DRAFT_192482 [Stachybotrys elegans]|uniref:NWD NACHT-NTPase N-terminal domain-containing protein n=1 Tax=Stachybotrys elegans TaxID=80388 RepID=A0A8K0WT96_9HYPO|nr:hypothetical protein B0I35DRAFT_192482 [Stachybotrys elegans]